jgi:hypothetical protein
VAGTWIDAVSAVGSVIGGIAGVAALFITVWLARKTVPEALETFRAAKIEERRAQTAESVWVTARRMIIILRALTSPVRRGSEEPAPGETVTPGSRFLSDYAFERRILAETKNQFLEVSSVAQLFLPPEFSRHLDTLWALQAKIATAMNLHAMNLDREAMMFPDAYEQLFGAATHAEIDEAEKALRAAVEPIAQLTSRLFASGSADPVHDPEAVQSAAIPGNGGR